jgi:hypothetical protein
MGVISSILIGVASTAAVAYVWYRCGFNSGRRYAIRQLFAGEKDFVHYLSYRRSGGQDALLLQKLVNCLRNDYGMFAEWDGLRNVWTIEVEHAEEADN